MANSKYARREFLKLSTIAPIGLATALNGLGSSPLAAAEVEPAELARLRKAAQQRRRRLIYNDDGCGPLGSPTGNTPDGFLYGPHSRMGALRGSQVESVFICSGATHVVNHPSDVAESYADVSERYGIGGEWEVYRANMRALEKLDTDAIRLTMKFCREQELEVFYSHRINDIHNTFLDIERSTWFREHPEYWMSTPEAAAKAGGINAPGHWWSSLDFERPEVLDYLCRIQEDVCKRFDLDGVDIDYFRSPLFFRPNLELKPATDKQLEILTAFQRRLREIHMNAGTQRKRPLLTAARVPATVAKCRFVGIDVEHWLKEGLVDLIVLGGGYVPFTEPLEEIVELAHAASIPVYATISASGMRGPNNRYSTVEAWRGAAANMWNAGVDGIETFNLFPSVGPEPRLQEIGAKETLAGRDKLFVIDAEQVLEGDLVLGIEQSQVLPISVPGDGQAVVAVLPVGDDLRAAGTNGDLASAELQIRFSKPDAISAIETRLNGVLLTPVRTDTQAGWLAYHPAHDDFRLGRNELSFRASATPNASHANAATQIELSVAYKR